MIFIRGMREDKPGDLISLSAKLQWQVPHHRWTVPNIEANMIENFKGVRQWASRKQHPSAANLRTSTKM